MIIFGLNPDFPPSFAAPVRIPIMLLLCAQRCLCNPRPPPASAGQVTPTLWLAQGPRRPKDPNAPGRALFIWISGARRIYAAMRFLAWSNVGSTSVGARRCYRNTLRYLYNNIIIFRYTICDGCWCFSWGPTYSIYRRIRMVLQPAGQSRWAIVVFFNETA